MAAKRFAVGVLALACLSAPLLGQETYKPLFKGDPAHSRSEAAALGYMRTVVDAQRAYKKRKLPTPKQVEILARKNNWHPYCSVAAWYLWRSIDGGGA